VKIKRYRLEISGLEIIEFDVIKETSEQYKIKNINYVHHENLNYVHHENLNKTKCDVIPTGCGIEYYDTKGISELVVADIFINHFNFLEKKEDDRHEREKERILDDKEQIRSKLIKEVIK